MEPQLNGNSHSQLPSSARSRTEPMVSSKQLRYKFNITTAPTYFVFNYKYFYAFAL